MAESTRSYFEQHDVANLLDGLVKELAKQRPEAPEKWLSDQLAKAPKGGRKKDRATAATAQTYTEGKIGGAFTKGDKAFIPKRVEVWDRLMPIQKASLAEKVAEEKIIKITLPNGSQVDGIAYKTLPIDIAKGISTSLAKEAIAAKVCLCPRTARSSSSCERVDSRLVRLVAYNVDFTLLFPQI
jgi:hypothetical protein